MKNFFQETVKAVSDFRFYKQVKDFPISRCIKYILILILLITLILTIRFSYGLSNGLDIALKWAKEKLPLIEIQNGIVKVDVEQPYKIVEDDFAIIIDTTGQITSLDEYKRGILLMKDRLLYKEDDFRTESYNLSRLESLRIDENFMKSLRKNAVWIIFPIMLLFTFVYLSAAKFFQMLLMSPVSIAISSILNIKLSYRQLINIGIFAITPSSVIGALVAFIGIQLPLFWILYAGLYAIYLIMAILNCREKQAGVIEEAA